MLVAIHLPAAMEADLLPADDDDDDVYDHDDGRFVRRDIVAVVAGGPSANASTNAGIPAVADNRRQTMIADAAPLLTRRRRLRRQR